MTRPASCVHKVNLVFFRASPGSPSLLNSSLQNAFTESSKALVGCLGDGPECLALEVINLKIVMSALANAGNFPAASRHSGTRHSVKINTPFLQGREMASVGLPAVGTSHHRLGAARYRRAGSVMSDHLTAWKVRIIEAGLFLIFLAGFLKFVYTEISHFLR